MIPMPGAVEKDVVVGAEAEGARRATGASGPMTTLRATAPNPEVPAKPERRRLQCGVPAPDPQASGRLQEAGGTGRVVASGRAVFLAADELAAPA